MSASLVTFANLGRKPNLRTTDILPIVETFLATGELEQVICQINAGFPSPAVQSAIPTLLRYSIRALEKLSGRSFPQEMMGKLFDTFAAWRLRRADVTFLHGSFSMPKTARRARALGSIVVDVSVSANLAANAKLESEEFAALGVRGHEGLYARLASETADLEPCDYLILMSDFARETYLDAGYPVGRIFMAYLDIDTVRFAPAHRPESGDAPFSLLYLAFTQPLKGLHYLLDAWESLRLPGAELVVVGWFSGMPKELEETYKERMQSDPTIRWITGSDKPEERYRAASAFVFPSLTEGFGRSTLEAMACGIPVITTKNARGIVEDGKTGFVVPIRDAKAIAQKIRYLYDHRAETVQMGRAARHAVETKKPFGEAVHEIYREILKREQKS